MFTYFLVYAHHSQWSIGHQRPPPPPTPTIALCSGLLLSFRTSWSPAVSALLQCLASNCCEAGLSSSSPAGSTSGLGVWCWMLASWGCVRSSPNSSTVAARPLVPVPLALTDLHFGSSLAIRFCRCASDRCWRMSGSFVASSVLSATSHIRKAGLTSHWSWRCGVWFSCWFLQMPRCFWAWQKLLLPCRFWLWRLSLCLPDGQPHFPGRRKTPSPLWVLHQLWLVHWQLCSSSSAQSSFCWSWALSLLMWSPGEWSCPASGCDCVWAWLFGHMLFWVSYVHVLCIFVIALVQRNWAYFTWKGALEICSLLLILLLLLLLLLLSSSSSLLLSWSWWRCSCR